MREQDDRFSMSRDVGALYPQVELEERTPEYFLIRLAGTLLRILGWALTLTVMFWLIWRGAVTGSSLYMLAGLIVPLVVSAFAIHIGPKYFEWRSVRRLLRWAREKLSVGALSGSGTSVMIPGTSMERRPRTSTKRPPVDD